MVQAADLLLTSFKTLWGASGVPFLPGARPPFEHPEFEQVSLKLGQLCAVRSSGLLYGPNGVGKSYLVSCLIKQHLSEKRFEPILLTHATLTGSDLLRALCLALNVRPQLRRSDNVAAISRAWQELSPRWPVVILEEAQELSAVAMEELRLLSCIHLDGLPFSMLFVGDESFPAKLQMGIYGPLRSRLGYSYRLNKLDLPQSRAYVESRLRAVSIIEPFAADALELLITAAGGIPRAMNHLGQRSLEAAAAAQSRTITSVHVQAALERLPWISALELSS